MTPIRVQSASRLMLSRGSNWRSMRRKAGIARTFVSAKVDGVDLQRVAVPEEIAQRQQRQQPAPLVARIGGRDMALRRQRLRKQERPRPRVGQRFQPVDANAVGGDDQRIGHVVQPARRLPHAGHIGIGELRVGERREVVNGHMRVFPDRLGRLRLRSRTNRCKARQSSRPCLCGRRQSCLRSARRPGRCRSAWRRRRRCICARCC